MGGQQPGSLCGHKVGENWVDDGTNCRSQSPSPGSTGKIPEAEGKGGKPSFLESMRQSAVVESLLGARRLISTFQNMIMPTGQQALMNDELTARMLLAQGDYERAFEVATGFAEYFDIHKQAKKAGSSTSETASVMMGHAAGFNQAVETVQGEDSAGNKLSVFDRIGTGLDALARIVSTAMTVDMGVNLAGAGLNKLTFGSPVKVVSPVYRIAGRDVVVVESSAGRQAFSRWSGGRWLPVDEFHPADARLKIPEKLGKLSLPEGQQVPAGKHEAAEMTLNKILEFFGAPETTVARPVPKVKLPPSPALARLESTRLNLQNMKVVRKSFVLEKPSTFRHSLFRSDVPAATYNQIKRSGKLLMSSGGGAHYGEGVYVYGPGKPGVPSYIDVEIPSGVAVEELQVPGEGTYYRLVPANGNAVPAVIKGTNIPKEMIEMFEKLLEKEK
jgi:hypothetical protein